ncbi:HAD-IA family hydrolase [Streptomyces sp. MB09-02B]|uniref:HAD-IA family hydrolase n=1 Tax=Streptomyces sp. MB09-02B TaxID=3028667 RepID=UPI0029B10FDA|nr:HAD-IA family hydrolase [Streptomyces sp. MB09-02B]MDX3638419.1 HAD-IA family hydrolase [Streptomyces sp. MB09-02B]
MRGYVMNGEIWHGSAVLFDLDGTLVDSMEAIERHTRMWAARHGLDGDLVLLESHGRRDSELIASYVDDAYFDEEMEWLRDISCRDTKGMRALPGAVDLIADIPPGAWGIVTSGERRVARSRLAAAGIPEPLIMVTAEDVQNGKPDPEGFLLGARLLGVAPEQCLAFEDSVAGIQAAESSGMTVLVIASDQNAMSGKGTVYEDFTSFALTGSRHRGAPGLTLSQRVGSPSI